MSRKILGTTVDFGPAFRDLFLAGGFSSVVMWAATEKPVFLVFGFLSGAILGLVLHILPPEPQPGDDKRGRIIIRALSGAVAGLSLAPGLSWIAAGAAMEVAASPTTSEFVRAGLLGLVTGAVWYILWGFWETRNLQKS